MKNRATITRTSELPNLTFDNPNTFSGKSTRFRITILCLRCICMTIMLFSCKAESLFSTIVYYVDPNGVDMGPGTRSAPWKTIEYAISNIAANSGATLMINAGTYKLIGSVTLPSGLIMSGASQDETIITGNPGTTLFNVRNATNITIQKLTLDGSSKTTKLGLNMQSCTNVHLTNITVRYFNWGGITISGTGTQNYTIDSCYFKNNGNGSNSGDVSNLTISGMQNGIIRNVTIIEEGINGVGGKGIGIGSSANVKMENLSITVPYKGLWANQQAPALCMEFYSSTKLTVSGVEICNSFFNNTVSIVHVVPAHPDSISIRVHNCIFKPLGYALEIASNNVMIDHNYIEGGPYPIANWDKINASKNCLVHHNVFSNFRSPLRLGLFSGFAFYNNTVDCSYFSVPLFNDTSDTLQKINNNIFINQEPAMGSNKIGLPADGVDNNLFFYTTLLGTNTTNGDPLLTGSGAVPFPKYAISQKSPACDKGVVISGISGTVTGTAPDLGAWEYETPYWVVGP